MWNLIYPDRYFLSTVAGLFKKKPPSYQKKNRFGINGRYENQTNKNNNTVNLI